MNEQAEAQPAFEKAMYGALLRQKRIEIGYRKAENFVADLEAIGYKMSRAALYRIERGEQEPTASFLVASSILLYGETLCSDLINPCIPQGWADPLSSDSIMRIIKKNKVLESRRPRQTSDASERAARYDEIMNGLTSYDFDVFPNGNCDEDHMYISVAYGPKIGEYSDIESYEINDKEDIEHAILNFLKAYEYDLPGSEIVKLVDHSMKKLKPTLSDYGID